MDAVQADPPLATLRALPFWFATTGVGLVALGAVAEVRRRQQARRAVGTRAALVA